ncbi:MAG: hypothetical protein ACLRWQ_15510, partial [Flavonifractor plautii]
MTAVLDTHGRPAGRLCHPARRCLPSASIPPARPPLMFVTLPQVFQSMPGGRIFALLFFVSVFFAGITSLMNMLEACGEALTSTVQPVPHRSPRLLVVRRRRGGPRRAIFLESLPGHGAAWLDTVTIYIVSLRRAAGVRCSSTSSLGMKGIRAELTLGRHRAPGPPLRRHRPVLRDSSAVAVLDAGHRLRRHRL